MRQAAQPHTRAVPIDLFKGWPSPALLPPKLIQHAASKILLDSSTVTTAVLEYGDDEGYLPLRREIAAWLTQFYKPKDPISLHRLCITGGASQNLACILQTFTDPIYTRNIFMVAPTYYLACHIFADSGFDGRLKGIPEDTEGVDLDFLENALHHSEQEAITKGNFSPKIKQPKPWRKIYKYIIYCVPQFANPTGRIMSLGHRQTLVRLARKYDALVVTDDVYDMLQWPSSPDSPATVLDSAYLPRIVDIDRYLDGGPVEAYGHAVSNCSFSKIAAPGLRTGWAEGTEKLAYGLSQTGSTRSGGSPSQLASSFLYSLIETSTLQNHVYHILQPAYARRYYKMISSIQKYLVPLGLVMPQSDKAITGGYFIWLTLPLPLTADAISEQALKEESLTVIPGSRFRVQGDEANPHTKFDHDIRVCFAWEEEDLLSEGILRLANVVRRAQRSLALCVD
ncbi:hypothetical protein DV736_g647, partial [Chaetothyriales sp. CBS 134916]